MQQQKRPVPISLLFDPSDTLLEVTRALRLCGLAMYWSPSERQLVTASSCAHCGNACRDGKSQTFCSDGCADRANELHSGGH